MYKVYFGRIFDETRRKENHHKVRKATPYCILGGVLEWIHFDAAFNSSMLDFQNQTQFPAQYNRCMRIWMGNFIIVLKYKKKQNCTAEFLFFSPKMTRKNPAISTPVFSCIECMHKSRCLYFRKKKDLERGERRGNIFTLYLFPFCVNMCMRRTRHYGEEADDHPLFVWSLWWNDTRFLAIDTNDRSRGICIVFQLLFLLNAVVHLCGVFYSAS